jgi:hypothetical protein
MGKAKSTTNGRATFGHHTNVGSKSSHIAILERM